MPPLPNRRHLLAGTAAAGSLLLGGSRSLRADESTDKKLETETDKKPGPVEAAFERDYPEPGFKPSWKKEQVNRQLAADFIIYAHSDLEMTQKLLDREPGVLNAAVDWGAGDFETALGGASHMGRQDIVEFLLGKGARPDVFCLTMLGKLDAVRSMIEAYPPLIDAKGPHGFSIHFHAQVGGDDAKPVLDYLQSVKEVELRPVPFLKKK